MRPICSFCLHHKPILCICHQITEVHWRLQRQKCMDVVFVHGCSNHTKFDWQTKNLKKHSGIQFLQWAQYLDCLTKVQCKKNYLAIWVSRSSTHFFFPSRHWYTKYLFGLHLLQKKKVAFSFRKNTFVTIIGWKMLLKLWNYIFIAIIARVVLSALCVVVLSSLLCSFMHTKGHSH